MPIAREDDGRRSEFRFVEPKKFTPPKTIEGFIELLSDRVSSLQESCDRHPNLVIMWNTLKLNVRLLEIAKSIQAKGNE